MHDWDCILVLVPADLMYHMSGSAYDAHGIGVYIGSGNVTINI